MEKYTVHLHFTLSNIFFCSNDFNFNRFNFNGFKYNYKIIEYVPPSLNLALEILKQYNEDTNIYFLKNHGLIITAETMNEIFSLYKYIFHYFNNLLNNRFCFNEFILNETYNKPIIIRNYEIPVIYIKNIQYCFPDLAVFIQNIVFLNKLEDLQQEKYNIIIYENKVYVCAENIIKLYYIIELLDQYKILFENNKLLYGDCSLKSIHDISYIQNMKEEKERM
jgi:hypothetical protein